MAHSVAAPTRHYGPSLWFFAFATVILAAGSLLVILWSPKALGLALIVGLLAVVARGVFQRVRERTHEQAEASSAVANAGLTLAAVAVAPLLAFAVLWAALLLFLGVTWLLNAIGII
jgi:hypothetical protein